MGRNKFAAMKRIGICIKSLDKTVLYQNETCRQTCGNRKNQVCTDGCMANYKNCGAGAVFEEGIKVHKNIPSDKGLIDAVTINDGEFITSILYYKKPRVESELDFFKEFNLSKTEMAILTLILEEKKNRDITKQLNISLSTLKTHLNNIYKKIPAELKRAITRLNNT